MTLRTKLAAAFAVVAAGGIAIALMLSYNATASLIKINTEQTYRALIDAVVERAQQTALTPGSIAAATDIASTEYKLMHSRQVIAQVLGPDGSVAGRDPDRVALPVSTGDRELAASDEAGGQIERRFALVGEEFQLVTIALGDGRGAVQVAQRFTESTQLLGELSQLMTIVAVVVSVLAGLGGWLVSRRVTRRLERLTGAAELVTSTGRLDLVVPTSGRDELGRLGTAFDAMLGELAQSREDQRRLVDDAGHELKTPLTSLRTNLSVLRLLDDLDGEARELSTMVNELVDLARQQRVEEEPAPVALDRLAVEVAEVARRRTGRTIVTDTEEVVVTGRAGALRRAVSNLVENAAKFDPDGTAPIEVAVRGGRVTVLDRGPGIAAEDVDRVFDRFYRAPAARGLPGAGLGLAIVHDVAVTHRGTTFANNRPDGGAAVGFTICSEPS